MTATGVPIADTPLWTSSAQAIPTGAAPDDAAPDQLVALPGTDWHVWGSAILRAPGFPADGLDRLGASGCVEVATCAERADAHLTGTAGAEPFHAAFDAATVAVATRLCEIAADP